MVTFATWVVAQEGRTDAVGKLAADGMFSDVAEWPSGTVRDVVLLAASCNATPAFWEALGCAG